MCDLFCLICASPTDLNKGESPQDSFGHDTFQNSSNSLFEKELEVIFTLRNVLEVPSTLCQKFLAENGQPTEWGISKSICSVCRRSLKETQDLFKKIQNLIKEYESLKLGLKNRAEEKCGISAYQGEKKRGKQTESVVSRVKKYLAGLGLENLEIKDVTAKRSGRRRSTSKPSTSTPKKSSNRRERTPFKARKSDEVAEGQFEEVIIKTEQEEMIFFNENDDDQDFPMSHLIEPDADYNSGWEQDVEETNEEQGSEWTAEDAEEFKPTATEKLVTQIRIRDYAKENARRRELKAMKAAGIKKIKKSTKRIRDYEKEKARREELKAIRAAAAAGTATSEMIKSETETPEQMELNDTSFQEGRPKRIRKPIKVFKADSDLEDENDDAGMDDEDADFKAELTDSGDSEEDEGEEIKEHSTQRPRPKLSKTVKIDKRGRIRDYQKEKERRLELKALKKNKKESVPIAQKRKMIRSRFLRTCPYCPTSLVNSVEYSGHILRVHRGVPKPYVCEFESCGKTFYKMTTLLMHIDLRHQSEIKNREGGETTAEIPQADAEINEDVMKYETNLFKSIYRVELAPQDITINSEEETRKVQNNDCSEPMEPFQPNNPNLPFECQKCNYSFSNNWMLETHILTCHYGDTKPLKCDSCDSRFQKPGILENHRKKFHPENTAAYNGSGISLQTRIAELEKDREEKREKIVTGSDPTSKYIYHCRKCEDVKFSSRIMAEVHLRRLHGGPKAKFKCSECELYFLSEVGRKMHCEKIHSKEVKRKKKGLIHYCSECDSEFKSSEFLERHMRSSHNGQKEFMCDACGQTFSNSLYLLAHQRQMHFEELGLEPIKCSECGQVVYSQRQLKNHIIIEHTKKYPYNCPFCSKGFTQEHVCNQHVRVQHFGIRAFICTVCGKSFTQIGHLKTHERIHTGEKPYKCKAPGCGREYSDKPTFNRHVETHGDQVHVCPTCNREFKVWHSFRVHCKTHDKSFEPRKPNKNRQRQKSSKTPRKRQIKYDDDSSEESGSNDNSSMHAQQGDANNHVANVAQPLLQYQPPTNIIVPHFYPEIPMNRF